MTTIYLGLGSNLGEREHNLSHALMRLAPAIIVKKKSAVYETEPMYIRNQPKFLNMVCEATTELSTQEVFRKIKSVESVMGEHEHNGPRIIDIDLLFYGNDIIDTPNLIVPHPKLVERGFVLIPLSDIAPDFVHPVYGATIKELRDRLA